MNSATADDFFCVYNEMHTRTHYLMLCIDENVCIGTFFEDIRTCDCFLWRTISFMDELKKIK